jgi:excisionase family DNA binding protein
MVIAESLVYTIEEAGKLLSLGRSGAYEAARRGDIPVLRIGRRWLVPRVALDKMLAAAGKDAEVAW